MADYLISFFRRAFPLADLEMELDEARADFNRRWAMDDIAHWPAQAPAPDASDAGIWCDACQRSYAKKTVYDAHLSSKKHLKAAEGRPSNGASTSNGHGADSEAARQAAHAAEREKSRPIALNEAIIRRLMTSHTSPLTALRGETKSNVERKQALTDRERRLELLEVEEREKKEAEAAARASARATEQEELEQDNERIYNPLKLPLGWDGKVRAAL